MRTSLITLILFFSQVQAQLTLKEAILKKSKSQSSVKTGLKAPSRLEKVNIRDETGYSHNTGRKGSKDFEHSLGVRFSFSDYKIDKEVFDNQLKQVNELNSQLKNGSLFELGSQAHDGYFVKERNRLKRQYIKVLKDLLGVLPKNENNLIETYSIEEKLIETRGTLKSMEASTEYKLLSVEEILYSLNTFQPAKTSDTKLEAALLDVKKAQAQDNRYLDFVGVSSGAQLRVNPAGEESELERSVKLEFSINLPSLSSGGKSNKALIKYLEDKSKLLKEKEENFVGSIEQLAMIKSQILTYQKMKKLKSIKLARTELKSLTLNRKNDTTRILDLQRTIIEHELKNLSLYENVHRSYLSLLYNAGKLINYGERL